LSDEAIIDAGKKALREYYDEEIIVFDSDIEFLEDDEE
jgi:hypothetical protein